MAKTFVTGSDRHWGLRPGIAADGPAKAALADELGFDRYWLAALAAAQARHSPGDVLLAPVEFMHFFDKVYPIHIRRRMIPEERIDWFLLHKGMRARIDPAVAREALRLPPHFANEVFVLFGRRAGTLPSDERVHLASIADWAQAAHAAEAAGECAALVKTFERPRFLARCLASLTALFPRILVVDDSEERASRAENAAIAARLGADYIELGRNRGAACAFNVGFALLLAEMKVEWISAFDDDIEMVPGGADRLARLTRAHGPGARANLYSGYLGPQHRVHREEVVAGERVLICRSCSGQHMHAHRSYWEAILPLPTAYARAPKISGGVFAGQGDDSDWWCSNWAPRAAPKRGGSVCVLPGLVTTFGRGHSTWGGPGA
jgi:hypothetical protein